MDISEAHEHIQSLYPPDSEYEGTAEIGREIMDNTIGYSVGYSKWRDLPGDQMVKLAKEMINHHDTEIDNFLKSNPGLVS